MTLDRRHFLIASASAAAIAACPAPVLAAKKAKAPVAVKNPAALAGLRQAVMGSFAVGFLTERIDRAKAGGGLTGGGFGGKSTARSYLVGLTDADFRDATEAAYAAFAERLKAMGITLSDRQGLVAAYGKQVKPLPNGEERTLITGRDDKAKARLFSPAALGDPVVLVEWLGIMPGNQFDFGFNMSVGYASANAKTFAKSSGLPVINALLLVDFADADSYGGFFTISSAVKVKSSLAAFPDASQLTIFVPGGKTGSVVLKDPVAMGGDYGTFEDITSGSAKTIETVSNVIGFLGGVGTNKSRKYQMTADPARWRAGVAGVSQEAFAKLTAGLSA